MSSMIRTLPVLTPAGPFAERAHEASARARLALAADLARQAAQAATQAEAMFRVASGKPSANRPEEAQKAIERIREAHGDLNLILVEFGQPHALQDLGACRS